MVLFADFIRLAPSVETLSKMSFTNEFMMPIDGFARDAGISINLFQNFANVSGMALRYWYLTIILRNRAEYRLILSRRGRRPSRLKSDDIPRD